jgi:hypothetical protein
MKTKTYKMWEDAVYGVEYITLDKVLHYVRGDFNDQWMETHHTLLDCKAWYIKDISEEDLFLDMI